MGRRESPLESNACSWARARGVLVAKLTELNGVPDRIFFPPGGKPIIIEFKAEEEAPEELQSWYLKTLKKMGYRVAYCDTKEKFLWLMKKHGVE
jgi:hypothetical protein